MKCTQILSVQKESVIILFSIEQAEELQKELRAVLVKKEDQFGVVHIPFEKEKNND